MATPSAGPLGVRLICLALLAGLAPLARGEEVRYHGLPLDESRRLLIEETYGTCRVGYIERSRSAGQDLVDVAPQAPGVSPRVTTEPTFLVMVRASVLKSSAPNYLQNPGEWYRITFETLDLDPEYAGKMEVPASKARDAVYYIFQQLAMQSSGINREALEAAAPLVTEIFKEAQRLPAEIYTSVLESRTGAYRITPRTRQRRQIDPAQTFAPDLDVKRPELGATVRMREREELPEDAVRPGEIAGPEPDRRIARPRVQPTNADIEEGEYTSAGE
ncbi:MAG: hypothetical protein KJ060_03915 [Candidatus Hydrogenedentes bacterium]|nr:hypothetical protein [Candidatus Hydrogenedentota bacterium]